MPRAAGNSKHYTVSIIDQQGRPVGIPQEYVSVTTVIGATLPKDGLVGWARNIAVQGMLDLAQKKGWDFRDPAIDSEMVKGLLDEFRFTHYAKRDDKAQTGTRAHDVLETFGNVYLATLEAGGTPEQAFEVGIQQANDKLQALPGEEKGYGQGVVAWLLERRPRPILVEAPMACHHHKVAGTLDLYWETTAPVDYQRITPVRKQVSWEIHMAQGARVVTDLKTSKDFRESHFIQVGWYGGHMVAVDLGIPVDHKTVLRVNPDGTWEEQEGAGKKAHLANPQVFKGLHTVYQLIHGREEVFATQ